MASSRVTLNMSQQSLISLAFTTDSSLFSVFGIGSSSEALTVRFDGIPTAVASSRRGKNTVFVAFSGSIHAFDPRNGLHVAEITKVLPGGAPVSAMVCKDKTSSIIYALGNTITVWDLKAKSSSNVIEVRTLSESESCGSLKFSRSGP